MSITTDDRRGAQPAARTFRRDLWWGYPLRDGLVLGLVLIYSGWAGLQTGGYYTGPYLSPLYSPCLATACGEHGFFLTPLGSWFTLSPALAVMAFPVGFRLTCYYYRKVYYRSYFLSPPACAVTEPRRAYKGEGRLPLILNNVHRYFWVLGILISLVLLYDAYLAFRFDGGWGVGVGSLVLAFNAVFFALYTLSCHSCRHIMGGRLKNFSRNPVRYWAWTKISWLNERHMQIAWVSLPAVPLSDLYVRLVASGVLTDLRLF